MQREYTVRSTVTGAESRLRKAADVFIVLLFAALFAFLLFRFILVPAEVAGGGVSELKEGEIVLVDRISKYLADYELGDILEVRTEEDLLLRVAAKANDVYEVRGGKAYLNGFLLDESAYGGSWGEADGLSVSVPEGHLLLLPDSRAGVSDIGSYLFTYPEVSGEVRFRITPIRRIAFFA